ncbi:CDP-glucose 4,6-dehydratase [Sediminitomix flava]|uniref:CDP-glucose 4,6-dehydratase n=2 Tax=Sediminitomix flava TaxID=379075 RepID=A0A315ZCN7_SEDFL|nr:CDP-glucose 4,6-dehydratase [Sediminitomix flava]
MENMEVGKVFGGIYIGKKVLITGHTGFKGTWLSIWLKLLGAEVYGYALEPQSKGGNFIRCGLENEISHKIGDIRDMQMFQEYLTLIKPDICFHLAAQPLVLESYKDPRETFETNMMGTVNFFEAVRMTPSVKVAVNVTTDKCYDNKEWVWGYREDDPMGGKDPYSASKGCSELITSSYLYSYFDQNNTCAIASARAGNVIGGGDWAENRIVPDFFRAINKGKEIYLRNPNATRPWQHVLDPLSGYLQLAAMLWENKESYQGGWNFGPATQSHFSVKDLAEKMIQYMGHGSLSYVNEKSILHEANLLKLDISKAVNHLQWYPVLDFDETVRFTVEGYQADIQSNLILSARQSQIKEYIALAREKNIQWAK